MIHLVLEMYDIVVNCNIATALGGIIQYAKNNLTC